MDLNKASNVFSSLIQSLETAKQNQEERAKRSTLQPPPIEEKVTDLAKKIKDLKIPKIKNLVFAGGGVKGFAYIGGLQALKRLELLDLKEMAATSVGCLFSFMIALKYEPEELYSFITTFEYDMVKSFDFLNALNTWGVENGEKIVKFLQAMLRKKTGKNDITFKELYEYNPIKYTTIATNLNTNESCAFNHLITPNHSVLLAIRKSFALPVIITPVKDHNDLFVDGGLLNNFPIDQVPNSKHTLGFCFNDSHSARMEIPYLENYLYHIFFSVMNYNTRQRIKNCKNSRSHVISIDPMNQTAFSFFIDYETRKSLWDSGYQTTIDYFIDFSKKFTAKTGPSSHHSNSS